MRALRRGRSQRGAAERQRRHRERIACGRIALLVEVDEVRLATRAADHGVFLRTVTTRPVPVPVISTLLIVALDAMPGAMTRHEREVRRLARRHGLSATHNGSHWLLRDTIGRLVTVISRTPSDPRWLVIATGDPAHAAPGRGLMAKRRRPARAVRRRVKQTLANAARRERGAAAVEEIATRPRIARHVDQLDHLLTRGAITEIAAQAGSRFARDFEHRRTAHGRLVGRYEVDLIRRPGKGSPPPDTPGTIAARERFEAAVLELGPLWAIRFDVAVADLEPGTWGTPPGRENVDALALPAATSASRPWRRHYDRRLSGGARAWLAAAREAAGPNSQESMAPAGP